MAKKNKVVVVGGGVAGLTAAHELAARDFSVTVVDRNDSFGGKAKSTTVRKNGVDGYPAEHGFRFFPGWYRHLPDTLSRIPIRVKGRPEAKHVVDRLVPVGQNLMAKYDRDPVPIVLHVPRNKGQAQGIVSFISEMQKMKLGFDDVAFFFQKLARFLSMPEEVRKRELDGVTWWTFVDAENRSEAFRSLAVATTRTLVAAKAREASAYTIATMAVRTLFDSSLTIDRVLDGPTSEAWLEPWVRHLESKEVELKTGYELERIILRGDRPSVDGLVFNKVGGGLPKAPAKTLYLGDDVDYYVFAMPVEQVAYYVNRSRMLAYYDPSLRNIVRLSNSVDWMAGIQFYLRLPLDLPRGHVVCVDSEWALTAIEQTSFWRDVHLPEGVSGVLSVDISAWDQRGRFVRKPAYACTPSEIAFEVWQELRASLNRKGRPDVLRDDSLIGGKLTANSFHIDDDVTERFDRKKQGAYNRSQAVRFSADELLDAVDGRDDPPFAYGDRLEMNLEPILINRPGGLALRPSVTTQVENLFLAGDYVDTATNLACMEGANEAARLAVNAILEASGSGQERCQTWSFGDHDVLATIATLLTLGDGLPGARASMEAAASVMASAGTAATRAKDALLQFWKKP